MILIAAVRCRCEPKIAYLFSDEQLKEFARQHELIGESRERQLWQGKLDEAREEGKKFIRDGRRHALGCAFLGGVICGLIVGLCW